MSKYVICGNCCRILRYADGRPFADDDPDACNCGAPLDPTPPPVVILDLSGDRYHFGNLTEMIVWLSEVVAGETIAPYITGMFYWVSGDMLPIMGCDDYKEEGEL